MSDQPKCSCGVLSFIDPRFAHLMDTCCPIHAQEAKEAKAAIKAATDAITPRDRAIWRAAMTLAHNTCTQESDRENDNDGDIDVIRAYSHAAERIKGYLEIDPSIAVELAPILKSLNTTPDGRPLRHGMCNCAQHCPTGPYHEKACCDVDWCDCWCHADQYARRASENGKKL